MTITSCVADIQLFGKGDIYKLHKYTHVCERVQVNKCAIFYSLVLQERNNHLLLCQYLIQVVKRLDSVILLSATNFLYERLTRFGY